MKRGKLDAHAAKAQRLEAELEGNREQLEKLSTRIQDLHNEAHEKELAAKRCEDEKLELQRKLDEKRRSGAKAQSTKEASEEQLAQAEKELKEAQEAVEA